MMFRRPTGTISRMVSPNSDSPKNAISAAVFTFLDAPASTTDRTPVRGGRLPTATPPGLLPITDRDAAQMWRGLRAAPLLTGYRGRAPTDTPAVEDLLLRLGRLAEACRRSPSWTRTRSSLVPTASALWT
jgi:ATP-grasp domain